MPSWLRADRSSKSFCVPRGLVSVADGGIAARDRRCADQRSCRFSVNQKAIEQNTEVIDRTQVNFEVETVLARDPVTLADLWNLARQLRNFGQLSSRWLDPDDRGQAVGERPRIDLSPVARDNSSALKALDALGNRRRRQAHAPSQSRQRHSPTPRELHSHF